MRSVAANHGVASQFKECSGGLLPGRQSCGKALALLETRVGRRIILEAAELGVIMEAAESRNKK